MRIGKIQEINLDFSVIAIEIQLWPNTAIEVSFLSLRHNVVLANRTEMLTGHKLLRAGNTQ